MAVHGARGAQRSGSAIDRFCMFTEAGGEAGGRREAHRSGWWGTLAAGVIFFSFFF